jgi:hypothetical protein
MCGILNLKYPPKTLQTCEILVQASEQWQDMQPESRMMQRHFEPSHSENGRGQWANLNYSSSKDQPGSINGVKQQNTNPQVAVCNFSKQPQTNKSTLIFIP